MYNFTIEEQLKKFAETSLQDITNPIWRQHYLAIERGILIAESLKEHELLRRAEIVKPLVRLRCAEDGEDLHIVYDGYKLAYGAPEKGDLLVWSKPVDIAQRSYTYDFSAQTVVLDKDGEPLKTGKLVKMAEFTCYHNTGDYYGTLVPSVSEVLQQIPSDVIINQNKHYAFEVRFTSLDFRLVYDKVLDRHISTVVLYMLPQGLPEPIRRQKVIYNKK